VRGHQSATSHPDAERDVLESQLHGMAAASDVGSEHQSPARSVTASV
jgi:hypothetical protein